MRFVAVALVFLIGFFIVKRAWRLATSSRRAADLPDVVEDIALASRIAAAIGAVSVYFLAPAGLLAFLTAPPLIVSIAPALGVFAAGALVAHALARLYDKRMQKIRTATVRQVR